MICTIQTGIPGSGKTLALLAEAASTPGLYLVAVPRTELIDEFAAYLSKAGASDESNIHVQPIHSQQDSGGNPVGRRLEDALARRDIQHMVILVTHEALFGLDPARLDGVHVRIDEVPDCAVLSGRFAGLSASHALEAHYDLEPLGDALNWSRVHARRGVETIPRAAYRAETMELAALYKALANPNREVMIDLQSWDEARVPRRRVRWWSIWTPMLLHRAASVGIAAAGFPRSLLGLASQRMHVQDLTYQFEEIAPTTPRARPSITIYYFTIDRGSTEWWRSDDGGRCLVQISRYLEKIGFNGYWSCNDPIRPYFLHRLGGEACAPRKSGTNSLRYHTQCCYIYSNKAQDADIALLDALGLNREAITQAREQEDIIQFTMRGAIRDSTYDGAYTIYLYGRDQAETLRDYLIDAGITDRVELVPVNEANIMDVRRPDARAAADTMEANTSISPQVQRERHLEQDRLRARERRAAAREKRQAEGTYRPRGRPRTGGGQPDQGAGPN